MIDNSDLVSRVRVTAFDADEIGAGNGGSLESWMVATCPPYREGQLVYLSTGHRKVGRRPDRTMVKTEYRIETITHSVDTYYTGDDPFAKQFVNVELILRKTDRN